MPSIFDLPHLFIVFAPGAGGNFLSGIFAGLINKEYSDLAISESGSSHTTISKKFDVNSDLSMGTFIDDTSSIDKKIKHYRELFSDLIINHPIVSWTHDFNNIELYRNIFPNSKIIVVTQYTDAEQLAVTFMHVIKNLMDNDVSTAIPISQFKSIQKIFKEDCINVLRKKMSETHINLIFSDPKYKNIVTYIYLKRMMGWYGLLHLVEDVPKQHFLEIIKYGTSNKPYEIDKYLNSDCVLLPYSSIMSGDVHVLLKVIKNVLSRELTNTEKIFVNDNYYKYRAKQNLDILTNSKMYYKNLRNLNVERNINDN